MQYQTPNMQFDAPIEKQTLIKRIFVNGKEHIIYFISLMCWHNSIDREFLFLFWGAPSKKKVSVKFMSFWNNICFGGLAPLGPSPNSAMLIRKTCKNISLFVKLFCFCLSETNSVPHIYDRIWPFHKLYLTDEQNMIFL